MLIFDTSTFILRDSKKLLILFRLWGFVMTNDMKNAHLKLRIPADKKEQIRQCAYSKGLSMSSFIRYVLSEYIDDFAVQDDKTNNKIGGIRNEK